mgnify:CR=1 FL=1
MIHKTNIFAAPIICGAALALALAAGCDKMATTESPTGFPEDGVVRIAANAGDPLTRADGTSSSEYSGTTLGLFIDYGTNDKYNGSNVKWTKAENAWTPEKQMLWKDDKTEANIYAYAPYVDGSAADAVNFEIPSDQTAGTLTADLVSWAYLKFVPNSSNNNFQDGKILISFGHRLVKLTFNFEKGNQFASDVTVSEAVLLGTSSKVVLNATNGSVTDASDAAGLDIKLHKVEDSQDQTALKYEAVFFPGDGQKAGAKMLQVKMSEGTVLNYVVPSVGLVEDGLKAGSAYEMKMRLGKDKIELAKDGITVGSWTDSGNLPGGEAEVDPNADVWDGKTVTAFSTGDSTNPLGDSESAPILIESAAQLAYLAQQVKAGESYSGKYFKLTKDLALAEMPWTPIGGYEQIAESKWEERLFEGNFDGGNHTIYGLKVVAEKKGNDNIQPLGLFGLVNRSYYSSPKAKTYIKDLRISGANVMNENQKSGILCGIAYFVDISGVEVSGTVTASGVCGGLVGAIANSTISNCKAEVKVTSTGAAGGICAESADLELSKCSVSSSEIVGTYQTAGLLGVIYDKLDVTDCTVDASVKGYSVGGLFGVFGVDKQGYARSAKNCTMTGAVTVAKGNGDEYGGGIAGWLYSSCSFENCGFDGTVVKEEGVDANKERVGAAIGKDDVGTCTFTDCWYNADKISGLYKIGGGKDNADYSGIEEKHLGK